MKIYCDMDMVLCNFLKGAEKVTGEPFPEKNGKYSKDEKKAMIAATKGFWDNLEWMPGGKDLWNYLNSIEGADVEILSAYASWDPACKRGKRVWIAKNLKPKPNKIHLVRREDKQNYADADSILVDDHGKNTSEFKRAGGQAVTHINTSKTISELKRILK